jgi:hypothetical protein
VWDLLANDTIASTKVMTEITNPNHPATSTAFPRVLPASITMPKTMAGINTKGTRRINTFFIKPPIRLFIPDLWSRFKSKTKVLDMMIQDLLQPVFS